MSKIKISKIWFIRPDRKERLVLAIIFLSVTSILFWLSSFLWKENKIILLTALTALIPFKLWIIGAQVRKMIKEDKRIIVILLVLFLTASLLFIFFMFDVDIMHAWAEVFGEETYATITHLRKKGTSSYFVEYNYNVPNQGDLSREQRIFGFVRSDLFVGEVVQVKYLPQAPNIVFYSQDGGYINFQIGMTLAIAIITPILFYREELGAFLKNRNSHPTPRGSDRADARG